MKGKLLTFIETPIFAKQIDKLGRLDSVDVLTALQDDLIRDPERGDLIVGTGGARKARVGNPNKKQGKSGGYRYIYTYFEIHSRIYLLLFYEKGRQDSLSADEKKIVHEYIRRAKEDLKGVE